MAIPPAATVAPVQLTAEERVVLEHLAAAWAEFAKLGDKHPSDDQEFCYGIHLAQQKIGMRVARRIDPDMWCQPGEQ